MNACLKRLMYTLYFSHTLTKTSAIMQLHTYKERREGERERKREREREREVTFFLYSRLVWLLFVSVSTVRL